MVSPGDRIRLLAMPGDPFPLDEGSEGVVTDVTDGVFAQVWVDWDSGRRLALVPGVDQYEVIGAMSIPS